MLVKIDQAEHLLHGPLYLRPGQFARLQSEGDVRFHGLALKERVLLKDHAQLALLRRQEAGQFPVQTDISGVGLFQPCDDSQQSGLAAPGRPQHDQHLARGDLKTDVGDDLLSAEALREMRDADGRPWLGPGLGFGYWLHPDLLLIGLLEVGGGIILHHLKAAGAANVKDAPVNLASQILIDKLAGDRAGRVAVAFAQKFRLFLLLAFERLQKKVRILFHHVGAALAADVKDAPVDLVLGILVDGFAGDRTSFEAVTFTEEFLLGVLRILLLALFRLLGLMITVMVFALREVLRRGDLRGPSPLDVSGRILFRVGEAIGATEIDHAPEELAFDVLVLNLIAGDWTGLDAVTFAEEFGFDGLRRRSLSFAVSALVVLAVRERLQRQRHDDDQCE